jgi:chitin disaccharide deacetylase
LLAVLPEGSTELMVHPGRCGAELQAARNRLKESREEEMKALVAPEVREAVARNGIELATYGLLEELA